MIGVDEVGRGAWAGPLLVVAVRLKPKKRLPAGVRDSKQLTATVRERLCDALSIRCEIGEGWVSSEYIDAHGLNKSLEHACTTAVSQLKAQCDESIILDGATNFLRNSRYSCVKTKVKADQTEPLVAAASIIAKVLRDRTMKSHADVFPEYGFDTHVGYGTRKHHDAINTFGLTALHRRSFRPMCEQEMPG